MENLGLLSSKSRRQDERRRRGAVDDAPANEGDDGVEDDDSCGGDDDDDDGEGDDSGGEGDPTLARAINAIDDDADVFGMSDDEEELVDVENATLATWRKNTKHFKQDYSARKYLCAVFHHRSPDLSLVL